MDAEHQPVERDVNRREFHLTLFACVAIFILAIGLAVLMYPAVFTSRASATVNRTPQIAFFGFCGLSCLLIAYLVDRQLTIQKLRLEIAAGRDQMKKKLTQASADLLETVPTFDTFEDRLTMEFRRAVTTQQFLSVFVIAIKLRQEPAQLEIATCALSDATKAISHKLREQDSIYVLRFGFLGVILPGIDSATALRVSNRLSVGLSEAARSGHSFDFEIYATTFPEQVQSLHDLEQHVCEHLPEADLRLNVNYAAREVDR
jgi:GGDEF domain-containing protein